jgi:hypothetical protein
MGAIFCQRPVLVLTLEKVSGNSMIQFKIIELFPHFRIEGVYTGIATVCERNHRGGLSLIPRKKVNASFT